MYAEHLRVNRLISIRSLMTKRRNGIRTSGSIIGHNKLIMKEDKCLSHEFHNKC